MARFLVLVAAVFALSDAKTIFFENRRGDTIWPGSLANPGSQTVNGGGWEIAAGSSMFVEVPDGWAGRFWGRTGCSFDGNGVGTCETGDCGKGLQCDGNGGTPPVTLAEIKFNGDGGLDFYDVSNVDGFNIPILMQTVDVQGGGDALYCNEASCPSNINDVCPEELQVIVNGRVVGCKSACLAFGDDQSCCKGDCCGTKETCQPTTYAKIFKDKCPGAYSYAYDDPTSLFKCKDTNYRVIFS